MDTAAGGKKTNVVKQQKNSAQHPQVELQVEKNLMLMKLLNSLPVNEHRNARHYYMY